MNKLDASNSPNLLKKEKGSNGVKKLNNKPLYILIVSVLVILLSLGYAMYLRGQKSLMDKEEERYNTSSSDANPLVKNLLQQLKDKESLSPSKPPKSIMKPSPIESQKNPLGSHTDIEIEARIDEEGEKLRRLKEKLYLEAITAPTTISSKIVRSSNISSQNPLGGLSSLVNSKNKQLDAFSRLTKGLSGLSNQSNESKNEAFLKNTKNSFDYLPSKKTKQISPYEIKTGTIIPGVLITGLNSELPGQVLGQVSENVYDTATGKYLLIPQGSKLIGKYSSNVSFGQSRLLVAWNRLVYPDGQTLNIGAMNGVDSAGYGGFEDEVDNHYFQVFGSAFLLSLLSGDMYFDSSGLVIRSQANQVERVVTPMEQAAGKMIEKQLDTAPTIKIRPGFKFNIFVAKDMILEPLNGEGESL